MFLKINNIFKNKVYTKHSYQYNFFKKLYTTGINNNQPPNPNNNFEILILCLFGGIITTINNKRQK
jgi:hypothetical protein